MKKFKFIIIISVISSTLIFAQKSVTKHDTVTTADGLKYIVLNEGNGKKAEPGMEVEVNYTGYLPDGKIFDSSYKRGEPIDFILGQGKVIKGWDEGIALMCVGDKFRLIIPPDLAYGKNGAGNVIPPNATLIFDTELMSVEKAKYPVADTILVTIFEKGIDAAIKQYHELYKTKRDEYNFKESQLNTLGYRLLNGNMMKQALKIFKLNAKMYPKSANVYDSLGEYYMVNKNKNLALENYKKSLSLNPDNERAKEMVKKLESK